MPFDPNLLPLPALLSIDLPASMTYNPATQTLSIVGAMTLAEKMQLLGFSPDPGYQAAINNLYTASLAAGTATYRQALAPLPGITSPSAFKPALFNQWQRLNAVVTLRNSLPGGDSGLLTIFGTASSSTATPGTLSDGMTSAILSATGWNATDFAFLASTSKFTPSDVDFTNEIGTKNTGLIRLQACVALLGRLGVSAEQLLNWSAFGPDATGEEPIAKDIQNTVKSKYDDTTWVTVGKPLNDTIREDSKEALIAYILAHAAVWNKVAPDGGSMPITTSDQLYEFFLIDVDMDTCMLTSRIVQANAAVQLFVQRCLMNSRAGRVTVGLRYGAMGMDEELPRLAGQSRGFPLSGELDGAPVA